MNEEPEYVPPKHHSKDCVWSICSCEHIAQSHDEDGTCRPSGVRPCFRVCKKYDGHEVKHIEAPVPLILNAKARGELVRQLVEGTHFWSQCPGCKQVFGSEHPTVAFGQCPNCEKMHLIPSPEAAAKHYNELITHALWYGHEPGLPKTPEEPVSRSVQKRLGAQGARVPLTSTNAVDARREASRLFPQGGNLFGYLGEENVYISTIRERGNKANVATATKGKVATRFEFEPKP